MSDPNIIKTLRSKRDAIEAAIALYERKIAAARRDLAHVNATMAMFAGPEGRTAFPPYMDTLRLFRRGEIVIICKAALAKDGPLDTRELALAVIAAKGLDTSDTVLRRSIAYRIVQAMRLQAKRGHIGTLPKRKGVRMWHQK